MTNLEELLRNTAKTHDEHTVKGWHRCDAFRWIEGGRAYVHATKGGPTGYVHVWLAVDGHRYHSGFRLPDFGRGSKGLGSITRWARIVLDHHEEGHVYPLRSEVNLAIPETGDVDDLRDEVQRLREFVRRLGKAFDSITSNLGLDDES